MSAPSIHWTADYCVFHTLVPKMRRNGQTKRACANDQHVARGHKRLLHIKRVQMVILLLPSVGVTCGADSPSQAYRNCGLEGVKQAQQLR